MSDKIRKILINKRGFTLLELLIVIAIIGILSVAFLPNALKAPAKARDATRIKKVADIQTAIEAHAAEKEKPPAKDANTSCFTIDLAGLVGITLPEDNKGLESCSNAEGKKTLYYYNYDATKGIYIIGVKLEVTSSANSKNTLGKADDLDGVLGGNAVTDYATLKTAVIAGPNEAKGNYYLAIGPV